MTEALTFHVNGELVPADEATVSVRDRGFMYGDAGFETLRAYGGSVFRWDAHADRLRGTCEALAIRHSLSDENLRERVRETLAANDLADAYVKLSISRGVQPGKLDPKPEVDPTVVVQVKPLGRGGVDGDAVWDGPATLRTVETERVPDAAIPSHAKTHNYLNGILARLELRGTDVAGQGPAARGTSSLAADEALMLDRHGRVAEGATSNVFGVDGDGLVTPSLDGPVLPGVTRDTVLALADEEGIPTREADLTPRDLREADEVFLTNTTWEVRPVDRVDDAAVGGGPVTELLARRYDRRVERDHY